MKATEIFKKLKFDAAQKSLILNAPKEYKVILAEYNYDKEYNLKNANTYEFVQIFATSQAELEKLVAKIANAGKYDCLFWICYPKGTGKIISDIKRETVWKAFSIINLRPVSQIAIDDTWSALRGRPFEKVGK